jgi:hypothetical protein
MQNERELLLQGIHTLSLAISKATEPATATELWFRRVNLLECLYRLEWSAEVLSWGLTSNEFTVRGNV